MRYITYSYSISIILVTLSRTSKIYQIRDGESKIFAGIKYSLISLLLGWWGLPWGPIKTIESIFINFIGGIDVTEEINRELYGVSEPDEKWDCPNCNYVNQNTSYNCLRCGYRLV